jgi:hypothetical protein
VVQLGRNGRLQRCGESSGYGRRKMTPTQIAEAQKLAREWRPKSTPVPPLGSGSRLLRSSDQQLWQPARR